MKLSKYFSDADFEEIKQKVKEAESQISGEIVPVIVEKCDSYNVAVYRAAIAGIFIAFITLIIIDRYIPEFAIYDPVWYFIFAAAGGSTAALLTYFISPMQRLFLGDKIIDRTTQQHAELFFISEQVFNTRQRTGILIFIALWERKVIIRADTGISSVVNQEKWDDLIQIILTSIKKETILRGILSAIEKCGSIVKEHGFHISPDDENELSNELRIEGE
ncbi:TPM domain-containing protein [Bacteroidota bacterium]